MSNNTRRIRADECMICGGSISLKRKNPVRGLHLTKDYKTCSKPCAKRYVRIYELVSQAIRKSIKREYILTKKVEE